jgi:hypothetical protein
MAGKAARATSAGGENTQRSRRHSSENAEGAAVVADAVTSSSAVKE